MRKCPRCGHDNVPRAIFCFQCGRNLDDVPFVRGVHGTGKLVEDALRFIKERGHTLEPGMIERLREARAKLPPDDLNGEPMTCLRCGTLNVPVARYCLGCGSPLVIPDMDFNLLPVSNARTNVGQVRDNNEDHVNLWALDGVLLAVVADGLGGAAAGEEASRLAVEAIQADFLGETRGSQNLQILKESELSERMVQAVREANRAVFERAAMDNTLKGMGTTTTLALIRGNRAIIAHVGDSRAYLVDGQEGWINQVTDDHSFVQALVASGHITPEQAKQHPMGNVLYRALGQSLDLEVDVYTRYLKAGDRLVICSDGLTRHLLPDDIAKIVLNSEMPHLATYDLIELANSRGGEDNVSVIVIMMQPIAEETSVTQDNEQQSTEK
ncbi:MAG: Stp1/IreP family PP2C-type Ser/Thr phosphatase [Chloroflexota bacterium]